MVVRGRGKEEGNFFRFNERLESKFADGKDGGELSRGHQEIRILHDKRLLIKKYESKDIQGIRELSSKKEEKRQIKK
jgi:hypothetical protein